MPTTPSLRAYFALLNYFLLLPALPVDEFFLYQSQEPFHRLWSHLGHREISPDWMPNNILVTTSNLHTALSNDVAKKDSIYATLRTPCLFLLDPWLFLPLPRWAQVDNLKATRAVTTYNKSPM